MPMITGFHRVTKRRPCPICGKPDWCIASDDGSAAVCQRIESPRAVGGAAGYWHKLTPDTPAPRLIPQTSFGFADDDEPSIDCGSILQKYIKDTTDARINRLAEKLGVTNLSLRRLGFVWAEPYNAWAIPMRRPDGFVCGIRLRAENGQKWAIKGSKQGLFIPAGLDLESHAYLFVCEGPTDAAALLDRGFDVVGRPSCRGCENYINDLLMTRKCDLVIAANFDEPKQAPDGRVFYPGQDGAELMARTCRRKAKIIYPPKRKDFRAWINDGASREAILTLVRAANYYQKPAQTNRSYPAPAERPEGQSVQPGSDVAASGAASTRATHEREPSRRPAMASCRPETVGQTPLPTAMVF